jgi:PKD repeat protein
MRTTKIKEYLMYPKNKRSQPRRLALVCALVSLGALTISPPTNATTRELRSWRTAYPDSATDDNLSDPCALCHVSQTKTSQFNAYGRDYRSYGYSFTDIESLNSNNDSSGASNLDEITANTQPGWTEGANNGIYDINGDSISDNEDPAKLNDGTLDPAAGNQPPVADVGGPYSGTVNVAVEFNASNSLDSDGSIASYTWDFGDGENGSGDTVSHTYTTTGTYSVALTVTDDSGDSTTATTEVTIGTGNQAPVADAMGPYTAIVDQAVEFDGSGSSDPDGSIVSYDWDFGDGSNGSGVRPTHAYASKGTYNVSLTVTDDSNAVDSSQTTVSVEPGNQSPTADPAGPYTANAGESLTLDGTGSSDPDGDINSYAWDFGDGSTGTGVNPYHTYDTAGTYNVSLTVTDSGGLNATSVTTAMIGDVNKQAPVANANGPYSGTVNVALPFSSAGSEDSDGSIAIYTWDFGDGSTESGNTVSHTYTAEGSYTVTLTVEDNDGLMDSDSTTAVIGVGNLSPTSDAKGPYSAKVNEVIQFDGSGSQDPDGSIVAYEWNFGDGNVGNEQNPVHSYTAPGTYNVTLTVYDDSGAMDSDSTTVTVIEEDTNSGQDPVSVGKASIPDQWLPSGSEINFTLPAMSAPLESVKQHCVFLEGVNMEGPGHGLTSKALGTTDRTMTLDIYMARTLGQATPYSQLQLGVISNGFGSISRYNWNEPAYEDNPFNAFERLFDAGAAVTEDLATRQRRSVLDCNLESLTQMRNSLGSFEQARLEHTDAIERIEARLDAATQSISGGECTTPVFNSSGFSGATDSDSNFNAIADLQCDIATLALKCDLTRVISIMLGNHQSDFTVPEAGVDINYHAAIHGRPVEDYINYRTYFTTKLQYLIQSLADTQDMDGNSLLDNTILLTVSDMGDARSHAGDNVPYMLAGGAGGALTTGRYLTLNGVSHNTILDTVAQAAGVDVNGSDYEQYGDGPISGIFN